MKSIIALIYFFVNDEASKKQKKFFIFFVGILEFLKINGFPVFTLGSLLNFFYLINLEHVIEVVIVELEI